MLIMIRCTVHYCKLLVNSNTHLYTRKINLRKKSIRYSYTIKSCFQKLFGGHRHIVHVDVYAYGNACRIIGDPNCSIAVGEFA